MLNLPLSKITCFKWANDSHSAVNSNKILMSEMTNVPLKNLVSHKIILWLYVKKKKDVFQ